MSDAERNALIADVGTLDPELAQAFLEAPQQAKILPSSLRQIHENALKTQHGEAPFAELAALEEGIKIADTAITAAREEIASEVGGLSKFDEAARPYEKLSSAAWLRDFNGEVRSFHVENNRGYWNAASQEEIDNGVYFESAEQWRMAQSGAIPQHMKEQGNGQF
jgi:hypothetical protein